jgi:two-component system NtrC family sensor kinase
MVKDYSTKDSRPNTSNEQAAHVEESPHAIFTMRLQRLLEISNLVGSVMELDEILQRIVELTAELYESPVCSIYMLGPRRQNLTLRASVGLGEGLVGLNRLPLGQGIPGVVASNRETIAVADAQMDSRHEPMDAEGEERFHAIICHPLFVQDELVGVMLARRVDAHEFTENEKTLFATICKQVAIVIEKSKMYFERREADRLAAISISLSEIAHYIKNLIQGMRGGTYFVEHGLKQGDLDKARKGWEVLSRGINKIGSLVENMLNYSREVELKLERHNVNSIIYDILHQIDDTAVEHGVALLPETHIDLPVIEVDYDRVFDAVLNLISNAIDAIPPGKDDALIVVSTNLSQDGRYVEIAVKDNGVGMSAEVQSKIFNLFFSTKKERGSGIGLAVTRKVVEQHGGQIQVDSEEGKGATFTIRLPIDRTRKVIAI